MQGYVNLWRFKKYDNNFQHTRRGMEIMATMLANRPFANNTNQSLFYMRQPVGWQLAMKEAMMELSQIDISELVHDCNITMSLMRNNTSIPEKYRSVFPFWYFSKSFVGSVPLNYGAGYETVWDDIDELKPIQKTDSTYGRTDEAFQNHCIHPVWPRTDGEGNIDWSGNLDADTSDFGYDGHVKEITREMLSLTHLTFVLPETFDKIKVTGGSTFDGNVEYDVSVVRFNPDGTTVGQFLQDGPYRLAVGGEKEFNLSMFQNTGSGYTKLVVSNIRISDLNMIRPEEEKDLYDYNFDTRTIYNNGKVTISVTQASSPLYDFDNQNLINMMHN